METINSTIKVLGRIIGIISIFYFMTEIYRIIGFFTTRRFKAAKKQHKYAIMVAARNEEMVIGNLINSIRAQDYPSELVDIFVVADNCTDKTAQVAREHGAYCYEREDLEHRTKGFALQFLVDCIKKDYGIHSYDGYFVFDADNILKADYITRMNEAFDSGEKIITSYRNTKNFDDNWISASYAIHWLRSARFEHRGRSVLRLAARVQGTGFLFASELIENGWNYTGLTEDRAFSADAVANGYRISYNDKAEFYDEQPTSFAIAMRQRIRWAKGHLQAVTETGGKLFAHIFVTGRRASRDCLKKDNICKRLINNLHLRFVSFDMLTVVLPRGFVGFMKKIAVFILRGIAVIISARYAAKFAWSAVIMEFDIKMNFVTDSSMYALFLLILITVLTFIRSCLDDMFFAACVFILERKRISKIRWYKKLWFCITFPMFSVIGNIAMLIALFTKVEWKPIPHTSDISLDQLNERLNKKQVSETVSDTEQELTTAGSK